MAGGMHIICDYLPHTNYIYELWFVALNIFSSMMAGAVFELVVIRHSELQDLDRKLDELAFGKPKPCNGSTVKPLCTNLVPFPDLSLDEIMEQAHNNYSQGHNSISCEQIKPFMSTHVDTTDQIILNPCKCSENECSSIETKIKPISESVDTNVETMSEPVNTNVETMSEPVNTNIESVSEPVNTNIESVSEPVNTTIESVSEPVNTTIESVSESVNTNIESVSEPVDTNMKSMSESINTNLTPTRDESEETISVSEEDD
jgi:hypothetical protein